MAGDDAGSSGASAGRAPAAELARGAVIDRYVVLEIAGRGGVGVVYAAHDAELDRKVALKLLRGDHRELRHQQALLHEARNMARLAHPNVVAVHDVGLDDGRMWLAMEFVDGRTLREWLRAAPRSLREIVRVFVDAGRGLAAAHAAELAHRDFKPENVLIGADGRARVSDFGLAHGAGTSQPSAASSGSLLLAELGTATVGGHVGTPAYMSPEQFGGARGDARSDQFSFCVALFEALWGARPFVGATMAELMANVLGGRVVEPPGARVPRRLRQLILRGLAVEPADRHPSMAALVDALLRAVAPTRRLALAGVTAATTGALAVALLWPRSDAALCSGARAELAGAWDDDARATVDAALRGTALPYAPVTATRVTAALDDHATRWVAQHTEACEATTVRGEQSSELMDRRMACLADVRERVGALVGVLRAATPAILERAVAAAQALPAPERCAELGALLGGPPPPPPAQADAVAALRGRLAQAHALEDAGEYVRGLALATAVVDEADALGYAPLQALAHTRAGALAMRAGAPAEAQPRLERGYFAAVELADAEVAAEAAALLAWVVSDALGQHAAGVTWGRHALAQARHADAGGPLEGRALSAAAVAAFADGRHADALALHREALALRERILPDDHLDLAQSHAGVASALTRLGHHDDAIAQQLRVAQLRERVLGDAHPLLAASYINLGTMLLGTERYQEAETWLRRAQAIDEQALPPDHPVLAALYDNLAITLDYQGRDDEAIALLHRAIAIKEARFGPDHPQLAPTLNNLAGALSERGRLDEAIAIQRRLLAADEQNFGRDHPDVAVRLINLAENLAEHGEHAEATALGRRGWAVLERLEPRAPARTTAAAQLVRILRAGGELAEATALAARERVDAAPGTPPPP